MFAPVEHDAISTSTHKTLLPRDIIQNIVSYLPLTIDTLLKWEKINKEFFSVAYQHWCMLWRLEHSAIILTKNYRFACLQLHSFKKKHNYDTGSHTAQVVLLGPTSSGKSALVQRIEHGSFGNFDPTMYLLFTTT